MRLRSSCEVVKTSIDPERFANAHQQLIERNVAMLKNVVIFSLCFCAAFASNASNLPQMRMTPQEVSASAFNDSPTGSSAVPGVRSKVLFGDPSNVGFYTILLFIPPHTTIRAHSHRDDRMAAVVSGDWRFGYGAIFDEKSLKTLPPGSVYSEPGGVNHFARTDDSPVIVQISGYGPTDTRYFDPANDPALKRN
jgi:quercetin dioxygenase-like cupin family protein